MDEAEVTYLIPSRPDARNAVSIGLLVVAMVTGGLIAADTSAETAQSIEAGSQAPKIPPIHPIARQLAVSPAVTHQHAEKADLAYVFDASLELAEHIAESVRPPQPITEPVPSLVTHYGEAYNGSILGCGTGYYSSDNPTIVAVGPALYSQIPCGTLLQICGDGGCIVAERQDACPGCSPVLFDLSESAFAAVCGVPSGVCAATVSVVQTCDSLDLAWEDRPEPEPPEPPERQRIALDDLAEMPMLYAPPEVPEDTEEAEPVGEDNGPPAEWDCPVP